MKYVAKVEDVSPDDTCPMRGAIRVSCPDLFGMDEGLLGTGDSNCVTASYNISDWILPAWSSDMDYLLPEEGDEVLIEQIGNRSYYVWTHILNRSDANEFNGRVREGVNRNVTSPFDRIIGMKNGSFIRFKESKEGEILIQCLGANAEREDVAGPSITLRGNSEGDKFITMEIQDKFIITIMDSATDDGAVEGITISDLANNSSVFVNPDGVLVNAKDDVVGVYEGKIVVKSTADVILKGATSVSVESPQVLVKATNVKLDGTLESTGTTVSPNPAGGAFCAVPQCLFTGAPHQGNIAVKPGA